MNRICSILAVLVLLVGCGDSDTPKSNNGTSPNASDNSTTSNATTNNVASNATTPNATTPAETVRIECVSDLVTAGGNYYALTAEITAGEARIELINYLAATPTSDPVEEAIWNDQVAAQFSPILFSYQTEDHFLEVSKMADESMYRGTMSGETQFGDVVNATCWPVDLEHPASYDAALGSCVDESGEAATNDIPWMVALRTGFGQCTRFEGDLAGETAGATFDFIDLRGSDFSAATLELTTVQEVQLEGADLSQITLTSASVSGTKDEHTVLPADGCQVDGDTFVCSN